MDAFQEKSELYDHHKQHIDLGLQSDPSINNDKLVEDIAKELENLVISCKDKDLQEHSAISDEEDEVKRAIHEELRHLIVKEAVNEAFQLESSSGSGEKNFRDVRQFVDEVTERNGSKKVTEEEDPEECRVLEEREVADTEIESENDGGNGVDVNGDADEKVPDHKEMDSNENHEIEIEEGEDDGSEIVGYENNGEENRSEYENDKEFENEEDLENENEDASGEGYEGGSMTVPEDGGSKRYHYPLRPDAEDCSYYMRTGMCKFGSNCKFNHPLRRRNQQPMKETKNHQKEENSERPGHQIDCKFYLSTGGCKYGKSCKFNHGRGKTAVAPVVEYNFLGLPIRPGERECPYYMRNGSCKYGPNCRFNHPDPTSAVGGESPNPYGNDGQITNMPPWSPQRTPDHPAPAAYLPVIYSPPSPDWNGYQALVPPPPPPPAVYPSSERGGLPIPPAFFLNNPPTDANVYTHPHPHPHQQHPRHQQPHHQHQNQPQMTVSEYPERPGQPECSYFMKTGDCKYRSGCKFHHPKSRISKTAPSVLSDKGLPLRPDQNMCTHYSRYGICKYGPACKYDHSVNYNTNSNSAPGGEGYRQDGPLMQQSM